MGPADMHPLVLRELAYEVAWVGVVQPGKEKALQRPQSSLSVPKGGWKELEGDFFQGHVVTGQGGMASKWKVEIRYWEEILYYEDDEALEQVS